MRIVRVQWHTDVALYQVRDKHGFVLNVLGTPMRFSTRSQARNWIKEQRREA